MVTRMATGMVLMVFMVVLKVVVTATRMGSGGMSLVVIRRQPGTLQIRRGGVPGPQTPATTQVHNRAQGG